LYWVGTVFPVKGIRKPGIKDLTFSGTDYFMVNLLRIKSLYILDKIILGIGGILFT